MGNEHDHPTPPSGLPPPPPPFQPPTLPPNLNLSTTLPITITVAAATTFFPITFTFTTDSLSIIPINFNHNYVLHNQHHLLPDPILPDHLLHHINTLGLTVSELTLTILPIPRLPVPTVITLATNTMFVMIDVSATGTVVFTPLANTTGVAIGEQQRPFDRFDLSRFTSTGSITLPIILTFNVRDTSIDTTIAISITISADSVFVTSDTLPGITPYVAFLAEEE